MTDSVLKKFVEQYYYYLLLKISQYNNGLQKSDKCIYLQIKKKKFPPLHC